MAPKKRPSNPMAGQPTEPPAGSFEPQYDIFYNYRKPNATAKTKPSTSGKPKKK